MWNTGLFKRYKVNSSMADKETQLIGEPLSLMVGQAYKISFGTCIIKCLLTTYNIIHYSSPR